MATEDPLAKFRRTLAADIRSVLLPNKNGIMLKAFDREYSSLMGESPDFRRLGHRSLLDLLRSLPEAVTLIEASSGEVVVKAVASEESAHIADLVRNQQANKMSGTEREAKRVLKTHHQDRQKHQYNRQPQYGLQQQQQHYNYGQRQQQQHRDATFSGSASNASTPWHQGMNGTNAMPPPPGKNLNNIPTTRARPALESSSSSSDSPCKTQEQPISWVPSTQPPASASAAAPDASVVAADTSATSASLTIPPKLLSNLQHVMAMFPRGLPLYDLPKKYFSEFSHEFDFKNLGCTSLREFCLLCPHIFFMKSVVASEWIIFPATGADLEYIAKLKNGEQEKQGCRNGAPYLLDDNQKKMSLVPEDVQDKVKATLAKYEYGVRIKLFTQAYRDTFGAYLDVTRYSYEDINEFLESLDFVIVDRENEVVKLRDRPAAAAVPPISGLQDAYNGAIAYQQFPPHKIEDYIDVIVGEIYDPGRFYMQLKGPGFSEELDKLFTKMNDFYDSREADRFKVVFSRASLVGRYCVAKYSGDWTRVVVTRVTDMNTVEVCYIDYGTLETLKAERLRYLKNSFGDLPAQAILARCARIRPVAEVNGVKQTSDTWSRLASRKFLDMVRAPNLDGIVAVYRGTRVAKVKTAHAATERFISIDLIDTVTNTLPNGIHFNNELIRLGLAEIDPDAAYNDDFKINLDSKVVEGAPKRVPRLPLRLPVNLASRRVLLPAPKVANVQPMVSRASTTTEALPVPPGQLMPPVTAGSSPGLIPPQAIRPMQPMHAAVPSLQGLLPLPPMQQYPQPIYYPLIPMPLLRGAPAPNYAAPRQPFPPFSSLSAAMAPPPQGLLGQPGSSTLSPLAPPFAMPPPPPGFPAGSAMGATPHFSSQVTPQASGGTRDRTDKKNLPAATAMLVFPEGKNFIRKEDLELADGEIASIHVLNLGDQPFLISKEISLLFPKWKRRDLLFKMIGLKKLTYERRVIDQEEGSALFEQAICEAVPGFEDDDDQVAQSVTVYRLCDLPSMITSLMTPPDDSLLKAVENVMSNVTKLKGGFWDWG